jgi:NitT/TauT family transport system ATP-binding protein
MAAQRKTVVMVTHDFDEAVYLSESVFVMSRHPGRIVHEFPVALDRRGSREQTVLSDEFIRLVNEVWLCVRQQVSRAGHRRWCCLSQWCRSVRSGARCAGCFAMCRS